MNEKLRVTEEVLDELEDVVTLLNGIGNNLDLSFVRQLSLGKPLTQKQIDYVQQALGYQSTAWDILQRIARANGKSMPVRGDGCC